MALRKLATGLFSILLAAQFGCASSNLARENPWPEYPPPGGWKGEGKYAGGYWWMPSKVGLTDYGNGGVIFFAGEEKPPPPKPVAKKPAPKPVPPPPPVKKAAPPEVKVFERIIYKAIPVKREVHATRYIFPTITFPEGSVEVGATEMQFDEKASEVASVPIQIQQAARLIRDSGSSKVFLEGHIDAAEKDSFPTLGAKRAEAVKKALVKLGVAEGVLETRDYAATRPLSTAGAKVGREINRRLSIVVVPRGESLEPEKLPQPDPAKPGPNVKIVDKVVERKIVVPELVITDRLIAPNIYFEYDKSSLTPQGLANTLRMAEIIKSLDRVGKVTVEGHCDWRGSDAYNDALSTRRSNSVKNTLGKAGVPATMLDAVGHGEKRPVASNDTELGMALNRRVEFKIEYR